MTFEQARRSFTPESAAQYVWLRIDERTFWTQCPPNVRRIIEGCHAYDIVPGIGSPIHYLGLPVGRLAEIEDAMCRSDVVMDLDVRRNY